MELFEIDLGVGAKFTIAFLRFAHNFNFYIREPKSLVLMANNTLKLNVKTYTINEYTLFHLALNHLVSELIPSTPSTYVLFSVQFIFRMELKKMVIETLNILLHGPTIVKTVFITHPASPFFNVKS